MSPRPTGHTEACNRADARVRARQARAFLDTGELVADIDDELATPNVAAALAVLAGIAASDAICCAVHDERPRGQDHRTAVDLLSRVRQPPGARLGRHLGRLLDIKDGSQYGLTFVTPQRAVAALRQARHLVAASETILREAA